MAIHAERAVLLRFDDAVRPRCVQAMFEAQAARTPSRIALQFAGASLTYGELNARANQIAHRLRTLGVGPEVLVALRMARSLNMVAALLGILKAGGAYVPLDPLFPRDRLQLMLEDSRASLSITDANFAELLDARDDDLDIHVDGENLAYVLYTSGSTGRPKGVQIPHRALTNFLDSMRDEPGIDEDDVLLAVTTLSFDIAGLELWLPLTSGARVVLVPRDVAADGRLLAEALVQSRATIMQATPATWRMLLEAGWKGDGGLKALCGGEAMPRDLADALLARCGTVWNLYGPTETTIWSTLHRVAKNEKGATVSIGKAIANTSLQIIDDELLIGGEGLARGYLGRPDLTAERFVPDPHGLPGSRAYRTGDAVREHADGSFAYLHRLDHQVKVRGFRIELGEVESALRTHPDVADACVIVRGEVPALAAYCIARNTRLSADALRAHLRATLPEYMVPSFFTMLDAFPLTPNRKIDRKALPEPQREARAIVAPRDPVEMKLAKLWCDVLDVREVSVTDSFFELGGDSLRAARLFVQIEETFAKRLPLSTLLRARTLSALAQVLRDDAPIDGWESLVPLQPSGTKTPLFCVHGVGGNVLNYRALSQHLGDDQPFYALQSRGIDGQVAPLTRIEEMARLYVDEIRRVQPRGPYFLAGLSFGGVVAFEMAQQLRDAGERVALVGLFDSSPVGYSRLCREQQFGDPTDTLTRRLKVHAGVLLKSPERGSYLVKKLRRVWRKVVYRSWQLVFALYEKLRRPLPRALLDVQQANYLALRNYKPRIYPDDVTFFYAAREPEGFSREKQHGWSVLAAGGVESIEVPGDHLTMLDEPHVRDLASRLSACIAARS